MIRGEEKRQKAETKNGQKSSKAVCHHSMRLAGGRAGCKATAGRHVFKAILSSDADLKPSQVNCLQVPEPTRKLARRIITARFSKTKAKPWQCRERPYRQHCESAEEPHEQDVCALHQHTFKGFSTHLLLVVAPLS
jgi:hypothetical protein